METIKVVLVGRHVSELPQGIEVVSQENITWETNATLAEEQFHRLLAFARRRGARVLLQNVPGILAPIIARAAWRGERMHDVGVIVSIPSERKSGVSKSWQVAAEDAAVVEAAVTFANGRAKVTTEGATVTVTVDPVAPFEFSHIEWF